LVFDAFDAAEKLENLRSAENDRQLLGLPRSGDARFQVPASLESNIVEEAEGAVVTMIELGASFRWFVKYS
jgi:hypothetical protein